MNNLITHKLGFEFSGREKFRLRFLSAVIALVIAPGLAYGTDKLDFSFIQGGADINQDAWEAINKNYIPGSYLLDVIYNNNKPVKQMLEITKNDTVDICFDKQWLKKIGVSISTKYFEKGYVKDRDCYILNGAPAVTVDMDLTSQTLTLGLPQSAMSALPEDTEWDYGDNALRVNYSANVGVNELDTSSFGSANLKANIASWLIASTATATEDNADISMFTASRPIKALKADLSVGKTYIGENLLGSAGVYGATLASNNSMRVNDLGYAPVFSGIAKSNARVTLVQSGKSIYSEPVPPGPFEIRNALLLNSGDVEMIITEQNGDESRQIFPLTVMNGMITPGDYEFNLSAGVRDSSDAEYGAKGAVGSLAYGYGLNNLTLRTSTLLHQDFIGLSGGAATSLGYLGGVSLNGAFSRAAYDDGVVENGFKGQFAWSKVFSETGTNVHSSWNRRFNEGFTDFSSFNPSRKELCANLYSSMEIFGSILNQLSQESCNAAWRNTRKSKNELNLGISQGFNGLFNTGLTVWWRDYWNTSSKENGLSGTLSTQALGANISLGASLSEVREASGDNRKNWAASINVSVPFTVFERRYSSFSTMTTGTNGGVGISSGISGSASERLSYSVGAGRSSDGSIQSNLTGAYNGDKAGFSASYSQSSGSSTGSASVTGSALLLPSAKSLIFSRTVSDTVAVANINNTPGVKFFSGIDTSDSNGNVVIPLSGYRLNTITVDTSTLPQNVELGSTSQNVVPVDQAVIYIPFETWKVQRYILQVKDKKGRFIGGGVWAKDENGTPLGFVAQNGVLMINSVGTLKNLSLGFCNISSSDIKVSDRIQEVVCE
ncbi:PefC/AfrB family outer membrane usher protein [Salmonella enterica]|nr:PefC/AfrB family outer membrane usher protein [Salmonella enterica]